MLKLRFSKPSVKTYNDGKVTVCKYVCTLLDSEKKEVVSMFTTIGTAKCAPGDTLDESYGRKLADSRAKLAAYKKAGAIVSPENYQYLMEKIQESLNLIDFVDTMWYLKKKEVEHIQFLSISK